MTYLEGQTSPHSSNYRAEAWVEHTLQNVGYSALHEPKTFQFHTGQPNWQLVRVKDYKLRLALPALLDRLCFHA